MERISKIKSHNDTVLEQKINCFLYFEALGQITSEDSFMLMK